MWVKEPRKRCKCKKYYVWNPMTYACGSNKHLKGITADAEIICDKFNRIKKQNADYCIYQNFFSNYIVINNYHYLLLPHKILVKTKRHITILII